MIHIFTAGLLWGTVGIFVKQLSALGVSPSQMSLLRMFFGTLLLSVPAVLKHGRHILVLKTKALIWCALLGVISYGLFNLSYTRSIQSNGMGTASVLMYTAPVFTALASRIIFRERLTARKILALVLNITGCVLTVTGGELSPSSLNMAGIIFGISSGFCYGMSAVLGRLACEYTDSFRVSLNSYVYALVFMLIFADKNIGAALMDKNVLAVSFLYGLIPTAAAYGLYYAGVSRMSSLSRVPVIASVEPITASLIGRFVYGEQLGAVNIMGTAVVLISIAIMVSRGQEKGNE